MENVTLYFNGMVDSYSLIIYTLTEDWDKADLTLDKIHNTLKEHVSKPFFTDLSQLLKTYLNKSNSQYSDIYRLFVNNLPELLDGWAFHPQESIQLYCLNAMAYEASGAFVGDFSLIWRNVPQYLFKSREDLLNAVMDIDIEYVLRS